MGEVPVEGYTSKGGGTVEVRAGETMTVTIVNNDKKAEKGKLIVTKVVVNDDGGTKTASDFTFTVDGTPYAFESDGTNQLALEPGEFHIGGVAVAGYESSIDHPVVTVVSKQVTTVTITNDDTPAKPPVVPPTETTPTETTPTVTTPVETTAPLMPPTTPKKPAEKKALAKAKPAPLTPPKKAVAGGRKAVTQTEPPPKLAYTP